MSQTDLQKLLYAFILSRLENCSSFKTSESGSHHSSFQIFILLLTFQSFHKALNGLRPKYISDLLLCHRSPKTCSSSRESKTEEQRSLFMLHICGTNSEDLNSAPTLTSLKWSFKTLFSPPFLLN